MKDNVTQNSSAKNRQSKKNSANKESFSDFFNARYLATWLGLGFLWLIHILPFPCQLYTGKVLGILAYALAKRRRLITEKNIELCFPELSPNDQKKLVIQTFIENATGLIETSLTFWGNIEAMRYRVTFLGLEHLQTAINQGKGIILIGAHYSNLDLGGALFSLFSQIDIVYRPHNNLLFDLFLRRARAKWADKVIPRNQIKEALRTLKQGHVFWFPADQDYGAHSSVFAPFFGVDAATITTPSRLAKLSGAPVLILGHHRKNDNSGYIVSTTPPLPNFPTESLVADAGTVNAAIEKQIRKAPAQYMWVHRRFKTRKEGAEKIYQ